MHDCFVTFVCFERYLAEKIYLVLYYFYTGVDHDEPHMASLCNTMRVNVESVSV